MHGFTNFINKHTHSRETTPPLDKNDSFESWLSSISSTDSRATSQDDGAGKPTPININRRGSYTQRSLRGISGSPYEFASSPRDRYPSFASYFREMMESRNHTPQQHHADQRRHDSDKNQMGTNTHHAPRHEYRHFVSPLYNEAMDDIQENEYSKCERYGEISSTKVGHTPYKSKFSDKNVTQNITESASNSKEKEQLSNERRGSGSSSSGHRHKHHSIQDLIRTFSKKVGHWRHDASEGRRGSCANPVISAVAQPTESEEFRIRSKSLDCDHLPKVSKRSVLEDCGATYKIFEEILEQGKHVHDIH